MKKTTDNQDELFDVVDETDNVIGQATRREVHSDKNLIHRSIGVVVFNEKGEIFLQQRSSTKDTDSLKWTISASGHVLSGSSFEDTAHRELLEELGLEVEIIPVVKFVCRDAIETEMQMLYKAYSNGLFKLNKEEIIQGKYFSRSALKRLLKSGDIKLSFSGKMSLKKIGWLF